MRSPDYYEGIERGYTDGKHDGITQERRRQHRIAWLKLYFLIVLGAFCGHLIWALLANRPAKRGRRGGSQYKGVRYLADERGTKKWRAEITVNGVRRRLGRYATEAEAAEAYNRAASDAHGAFAYLNKLPAEQVSAI